MELTDWHNAPSPDIINGSVLVLRSTGKVNDHILAEAWIEKENDSTESHGLMRLLCDDVVIYDLHYTGTWKDTKNVGEDLITHYATLVAGYVEKGMPIINVLILTSYTQNQLLAKRDGLKLTRFVDSGKYVRVRRHVGKCPSCGSELMILSNEKLRKSFIGCCNYPNCKYSKRTDYIDPNKNVFNLETFSSSTDEDEQDLPF